MAKRMSKEAPARFIKLDASGKELPITAKEWSQVLDRETNLIWTADTIGNRVEWEEAKSVASAHKIGKQTGWRVPTIKELFSIADHSRSNPAIDTTFFRCNPNFYWSETALASSPSGYAWIVYFLSGYVDYDHQSSAAFVRAVRSARASQ